MTVLALFWLHPRKPEWLGYNDRLIDLNRMKATLKIRAIKKMCVFLMCDNVKCTHRCIRTQAKTKNNLIRTRKPLCYLPFYAFRIYMAYIFVKILTLKIYHRFYVLKTSGILRHIAAVKHLPFIKKNVFPGTITWRSKSPPSRVVSKRVPALLI